MKVQLVTYVAAVLTFLSQGYAQKANLTNLMCYDCDPRNNGQKCLNPEKNAVQYTNCDQKFPSRSVNSTLLCLSSNITFTGDQRNETGIYRGCQLQDETVANFCDWYSQETDRFNAILVSCVTCNSTRCNNVMFNPEDGQPIPNKSLPTFNMIFTFLVCSVLFATIF